MESADNKFDVSEKNLVEAKSHIRALENEMNGYRAKTPSLERDIVRLQESVNDRDKLISVRDTDLKEARLKIEDTDEINRAKKLGISDFNKKYSFSDFNIYCKK